MSLIVTSNRQTNRQGARGVDNGQVLMTGVNQVGKEWAQARILSEKRSKQAKAIKALRQISSSKPQLDHPAKISNTSALKGPIHEA